MKKTKFFTGYYKIIDKKNLSYIEVDEQINSFLNSNDVNLVDVKLTIVQNGDVPAHSALLIYEEN